MTEYQDISMMLDANAITNVVDAYKKGRADALKDKNLCPYDTDSCGYAKGRADAIEEMLLDINSRMALIKMYADEDERKANAYDENYHKGGLWELGIMRDRLEQIKEKKNES